MSPAQERKNVRRKEILRAALECFIQYGYGKTTFDDVARKAGVSRSLLYAYFDDKKDLFLSLVKDILDEYRRKTDAILKSGSSEREKFLATMELWGVELYSLAADSPHGRELLEEGLRAWEEMGVKYKEFLIRALAGFVGGAEVAELLVLCIKGVQGDRPTVAVVRKRVKLLAELGWQRRTKP